VTRLSISLLLDLEYQAMNDANITTPHPSALLGRVVDFKFKPLDGKGELVPRTSKDYRIDITPEPTDSRTLITGIKSIDLLLPIQKGSKIGVFGRERSGKTVLIMELINNVAKSLHSFTAVFVSFGMGYEDFRIQDANAQKIVRLLGSENDSQDDYLSAVSASLTAAEHFRDEGNDVLLVIDSSSRFTQAGSEVSALLGRIPSAVGYQPTLATEMGTQQERKGSITSVQAIYVPSDEPEPANSSDYNTKLIMSLDIASKGDFPAIDLLESRSISLVPDVVGEEHYDTARRVQDLLVREALLNEDIPILGVNALTEEDKLTVDRARKVRTLFSPSTDVYDHLREIANMQASLRKTIAVCNCILAGQYDGLTEEGFMARINDDPF
jgi:F-type H+-transporting ATPase subunit beta